MLEQVERLGDPDGLEIYNHRTVSHLLAERR